MRRAAHLTLVALVAAVVFTASLGQAATLSDDVEADVPSWSSPLLAKRQLNHDTPGYRIRRGHRISRRALEAAGGEDAEGGFSAYALEKRGAGTDEINGGLQQIGQGFGAMGAGVFDGVKHTADVARHPWRHFAPHLQDGLSSAAENVHKLGKGVANGAKPFVDPIKQGWKSGGE